MCVCVATRSCPIAPVGVTSRLLFADCCHVYIARMTSDHVAEDIGVWPNVCRRWEWDVREVTLTFLLDQRSTQHTCHCSYYRTLAVDSSMRLLFFFLSSLVLCLFPSVCTLVLLVRFFTLSQNLIINHQKFLCTRTVLLTSPCFVCRIKTSFRREYGRRAFILQRCINSQSRE